jgi:alcohol dehydrogenase (cytochrome c)/quinohemoprotein ethanol dehydrogenase
MTIADLVIDGQMRRVLMQAPKNGFFYVLDAATGELISAEPLTEISWATHVDLTTGRPVETPDARYDATGRGFRSRQNPNGVHTWHSMSYSRDTGLVYIPIHQGNFTFAPDRAFALRPMTSNVGIGPDLEAPTDPAVLAREFEEALASAQGRLIAWDPVAQREVWRVERAGPANGGALSTSGGLVFQGTGTGQFTALDARTGDTLWSAETQTGVMAAPATYEVGGVQYVAIAVGTGGSWGVIGGAGNRKGNDLPNRSRLLVYALDGSAALPPPAPPPERVLVPPPATADADTVAAGAGHYATYCSRCHGFGADGSGILPDLRYSAMLSSAESFAAVLLDGTLAPRGMASFRPVLDADATEAIRAYVIDRAHALPAAGQ